MRKLRLVYLGNAFPPGVSSLFPELQPAGHLIETSLIRSVRGTFEIRSVGISGLDLAGVNVNPASSPGLPNVLNLVDRPPELWHWIRSLGRLRRAYKEWGREGWRPDLILVCNFSPHYNAFVRWLCRQSDRPRLVLYVADSTLLGVALPRVKRLRYRLKPFKWIDDEMAELYDACVAVSADTQAWFHSRRKPWLWLPNGIDPSRLRVGVPGPSLGPIVLGYFGHAGEHTGVPQLLRVFVAQPRHAELRVCCFGKARTRLADRYAGHPHVSFHGPFDPEGCVEFGTGCDVLVNPRPIFPGNQNNFPSKVFEYALTGRPILTSRVSGVDQVLGPDAFFFDIAHYESSLASALSQLLRLPRSELNSRGRAVQERLRRMYSWEKQGERLAAFLINLTSPVDPGLRRDGTCAAVQ